MNIHIETNLKQDFIYSLASALYLSRQPHGGRQKEIWRKK